MNRSSARRVIIFSIVLAAVAIIFHFMTDTANADTVYLNNGNRLHGRTVQYDEKTVKLEFKRGGYMLLKTKNVEKIVLDNTDQFEMRKKK